MLKETYTHIIDVLYINLTIFFIWVELNKMNATLDVRFWKYMKVKFELSFFSACLLKSLARAICSFGEKA